MPPVAATLLAQAKINLALRVLARETTGYHQLETLYCRIALGDSVTVRVDTPERTLHCSGEAMPQEGLGSTESNLAWRAAVAYAEAATWPAGFSIDIQKRIPVGGGLGGGSADAGGVLRLLNALNPLPLPSAALLSLAGTLGADVAFLTQDASALALAWGRGDRLLALRPLAERRLLLFVFGHGVPTKEAYAWLARTPPPSHGAAALDVRQLETWGGVAAIAHNDFESVVLPRFRLLELTLRSAREGMERGQFGGDAVAQMTGSGSTVFLVAGEENEAASTWKFPLSAGVKMHVSQTSARVEPVVLID